MDDACAEASTSGLQTDENVTAQQFAKELSVRLNQESSIGGNDSDLIKKVLSGDLSLEDLTQIKVEDGADDDGDDAAGGSDDDEEQSDNDDVMSGHSEALFSRSVLIDCLAQRDFNKLAERCIEALRKKRYVADACKFLGLLFEEIGDHQRFLTFSILSQNVRRSKRGKAAIDASEWVTLASQCIESNKLEQATFCLTRALRSRKKDPEIICDRAGLYLQQGRTKQAIADYCTALEYFDPDDSGKIVNTFKTLSKIYYTSDELHMSRECMLSIFKNYPQSVTSVEVNSLLDLYLEDKMYLEALQLLSKYCEVNFMYGDSPNLTEFDSANFPHRKLKKCVINPAMSIDLRVKTVQCLVELGCFDAVGDNLNPLFDLDINDVGDLYIELIHLFDGVKNISTTACLLKRLLECDQYSNNPDLLLKYGKCLQDLGQVDEAVNMYRQVLSISPGNSLARLQLSYLHKSQGEVEGARELVVSHHLSLTEIPVSAETFFLQLDKCNMLYETNSMSPFIDEAGKLMYLLYPYAPTEPLTVPSVSVWKSTAKSTQKSVLCNVIESNLQCSSSQLLITSVWEIFYKLCQVLANSKRFHVLFQHVYSGLNCGFFFEIDDLHFKTKVLGLMASYYSKKFKFALDIAKALCIEFPKTTLVYNLLNIVGHEFKNLHRHRDIFRKTIVRMLDSNSSNYCLLLEDAHRTMESRYFKQALIGYLYAFQQNTTNPMYSLLIAVCYSNMAGNKYLVNRHTVITQALAFLNHYFRCRGECQESYYNLGRAMTQWGLNYLAIFYYKKALSLKPSVSGDPSFDLTYDIAYNLAKIYELSGNNRLAYYYIRKYCVV